MSQRGNEGFPEKFVKMGPETRGACLEKILAREKPRQEGWERKELGCLRNRELVVLWDQSQPRREGGRKSCKLGQRHHVMSEGKWKSKSQF